MQQCEVQAGETLISISIRESVSVAVLRRLNKLYGNDIYPGQVLVLRSAHKAVEAADCPEASTSSTLSGLKRVNSKNNVGPSSLSKPFTASDAPTNRPPLPPPSSEDNSLSSSAAFVGITLLEAMTDTKAAMLLSADNKMASIRSFVNSLKSPTSEGSARESNGRIRSESGTSLSTMSEPSSDIKTLSQDDLDKIPPTLSGKRNILTVHQARQLRAFLPSMQQIETWKLLYSVLNDGADMNTFFRKSSGHKYTVIIALTMNGEVFGGFNSVEWNTSPNFCESILLVLSYHCASLPLCYYLPPLHATPVRKGAKHLGVYLRA